MRKTILSLHLLGCSFTSMQAFEKLDLDILSYEKLIAEDSDTLHQLDKALHEKGIVAVQGVPGYTAYYKQFVQAAREFTALPEEIKENYAPDRARGDLFLGYEKGKEKFKRDDGKWVVDDLKVSYYAFVPDTAQNRWPEEINLQTSFLQLGGLMSEIATLIMEKISLIGPSTGIFLGDTPRVGRMLYYQKSENIANDNPYWCGAHFDSSLFTVLTPAVYFTDNQEISEPEEAGLSVKVQATWKKVVADPELLLFQVGEFGQLATNDAIQATEHRVQKASGPIERYAMALFFNPPLDTVIHSFSELTKDPRYGGPAGGPCSFRAWHEASFNRYIFKEK